MRVGDSKLVLQSLKTSKMRKFQTIKLSEMHKAKTCLTTNLIKVRQSRNNTMIELFGSFFWKDSRIAKSPFEIN